MRENIFLLTDFGYKDYYVAAMKGVILSINPGVKIIDISHNITKWSICEGAFLLWQLIDYLPCSSIIVGVVDPGVGSERRCIIIETNEFLLVGPDNGLLYPAAEKNGIKRVYEILIPNKYIKEHISATFHGRDIFAPVAAYISLGVNLEELGKVIKVNNIVKLSLFKNRIEKDRIITKILHIDDFGNLILSVLCKLFYKWSETNDSFYLEYRDRKIPIRLVKTFLELSEREIGLVCGSSSLIEIVMNKKRAADYLGINVGEDVIIQKLGKIK